MTLLLIGVLPKSTRPIQSNHASSEKRKAETVRSANFTREGLALNIEAAISLDTRDGDDDAEVAKIAAAIDDWFAVPLRAGITLVDCLEVIEQLVENGILSEIPPPRPSGGGSGTGTTKPTLAALSPLPTIPMPEAGPAGDVEDDDDFVQPALLVAVPIANVSPVIPPVVVQTASTPTVAAGLLAAPAGVLRFGMTLQNTDVGVGQTDPTQVTQRRSPEVFVPMRALDLNPAFWGWPANYAVDQAWASSNATWIANELLKPANPLRPRMKVDWQGCNIRLIRRPGLITATIWHNPKKNDIRIRAEDLRSAGNVGDILVMWPAPAGSGYDYVAEVVPATSPTYTTTLANLTVHVTNSQKVIGYF